MSILSLTYSERFSHSPFPVSETHQKRQESSSKIKTKFKYADKLNIPYVIVIGEDEIIPTPFSQQPLVVKGVSDSTEVIGQMIKNQKGYALKLYNQINKSGNYNIISNGKVVSGFSLNYSSKESIMEFADKKQVSKQLQDYSIEKKLPFSYLFLLFALLTIIVETILIYKLNKIKK